eukprot:TRINITY_DN24540_c0_g1_i1.p1 TRINITY_DN24540_c0_g1~~TRINITY_DN24540_c0_g1_i1.p1  ORF type:complete len:313 (-),score=36.50 TRINITY_DN24540_c0_g1_i1:11-841(-)
MKRLEQNLQKKVSAIENDIEKKNLMHDLKLKAERMKSKLTNTDKLESRSLIVGVEEDDLEPQQQLAVPLPPSSEPSSFIQGTIDPNGGPAPPPLRDLEYYKGRIQMSDDYDLRSAYFLSSPVVIDGPLDQVAGNSEYRRLSYTSSNNIKRTDETIFGGVIGGLTGVFGFLLSKKVIFAFVFLALLLSLGLTGTTPAEAFANFASNFGLGYDVNVAVSDADGNHIGSSSSLYSSISDVLVSMDFTYLGNMLGFSVEGGHEGADVQVYFDPNTERKKR